MRVGVVILPEHPWKQGQVIWRNVENMGFHHAWTYDHIAWRTLRGGPWFDCVTTLAAAATATERVLIGSLVASPNIRHPLTWSQSIRSLDDLSSGRFVAGIGAGAGGYDTTAMGAAAISLADRAARFTEFVEVCDLLLGPGGNYEGRFYKVEGPCATEARRRTVPFALAATGPRGLDLVARYAQMWVTNGDPHRFAEVPEEEALAIVAQQRHRLVAACERAGRAVSDLSMIVNGSVVSDNPISSVEKFVDFASRCSELGFTDLVVHYPRPTPPFEGDVRVFERIASEALPTVARLL